MRAKKLWYTIGTSYPVSFDVFGCICNFDYVLRRAYIDFCTDEVAKMQDRPEEWSAWLEEKNQKADMLASIRNRNGPSMGIKFPLERSWERKIDFVMFLLY